MKEATNELITEQPVIRLTPVKVGGDLGGQIALGAVEMIAYSGGVGLTRLHLIGRRVLEVKETTQEIDRLVREAAR